MNCCCRNKNECQDSNLVVCSFFISLLHLLLLFTFMQLIISKHLCVLILINRSAVGPVTLALRWENIAISSRTIIFLWWGPPPIDFLNHSHLNLSVCLIGTLARLNASRGKWDYCVSAWGLNALEINGGCISNPPALHCTILSVSFCSLPAFQPQIFYYFFHFFLIFSLSALTHSLSFLPYYITWHRHDELQ